MRGTRHVSIEQAYSIIEVPDVLTRSHQLLPDVEIKVHPAAGGTAVLPASCPAVGSRSGWVHWSEAGFVDVPRAGDPHAR